MTYLAPPELEDLPPPPPGRVGWPWTEASEPYPAMRADGSNWPSLRVVTPSFGQAEYIEETIRSVLLQGYPRLEYFVIDGGSKDGTVGIVEKYSPWLSGWRSEPDKGQVEAIKKGLEGAKTDYFTWLNSDDLFEKDALRIFSYAKEGRAVAGVVRNFLGINVIESKKNDGLDLVTFTKRWSPAVFHQPGIFWPFSTSLINALDEDLHYAFDVKLLLQYLLQYGSADCVEHPVARFRLHDGSKTVADDHLFLPERVAIFADFAERQRDKVETSTSLEFDLRAWSEFLQLKMREGGAISAIEVLFASLEKPHRLTRETLGALRRIVLSRGKRRVTTQKSA